MKNFRKYFSKKVLIILLLGFTLISFGLGLTIVSSGDTFSLNRVAQLLGIDKWLTSSNIGGNYQVLVDSHRDGGTYCSNHGGVALTSPNPIYNWSECLTWCDTQMNGTTLPLCQMNSGGWCWVNRAPSYVTDNNYGDINSCSWGTGANGAWWAGFEPSPTPSPTAGPTNTPGPTATPAPSLTPIVLVPRDRISSGYGSTCVLTNEGGVKCWGWNNYGQLGNGTTDSTSNPVDVIGLTSDVKAVASSAFSSCALTTTGGVKCWGSGGSGQIGDGDLSDHNTAVDVTGLSSGVQSIYAGGYHVCAIIDDGGVKCWGADPYGFSDSSTPISITALGTGTRLLTLGGYHTCALMVNGGVKCWGDNYNGQLGNGNNNNSYSTLVDVVGLSSGVESIGAGSTHTCAVLTGGGVKCWGSNNNGELGNNTIVPSSEPVQVNGLTSGYETVSGGGNFTCAVSSTGGVMCWGANGWGYLGNGSQTDLWEPVAVTNLSSGVEVLAGGLEHTCVLTTRSNSNSNAFVKCWGLASSGQMGNTSGTNPQTTPIIVDLPPPNDNFENARVLSSFGDFWSENMNLATIQVNEPLSIEAGRYTMNHSVWYKFVATGTGLFRVGIQETTVDYLIAAYTATDPNDITTLTLLDSNRYGGGSNTTHVAIPVNNGDTYYIQIGTRLENLGATRVRSVMTFGSPNYPSAPANDNFSNPIVITRDGATLSETNMISATLEANEPKLNISDKKSAWYTFTNDATPREVWVDTCNSADFYDTILSVHQGSSLDTLTLIARNDDNPGTTFSCGSNTESSWLTFNAGANETYYIRVSVRDNYNRTIYLSVRSPIIPTFTPTPEPSPIPGPETPLADWMGSGTQNNENYGTSVSAGDVNGDGHNDVIVGVQYYKNDNEEVVGAAFVYYGSDSGLPSTPSLILEGDQADSLYGRTVAGVGDVNDDGYDDVLVGAPLYDNGETDEGRVYLYLGSAGGLSPTAIWTTESNMINAKYGFSLSGAGDINNDGIADFVIGAPLYTNGSNKEGRAYLFYGSATPTTISTTPAWIGWTGAAGQNIEEYGNSVSGAGDVNCDGNDDLIIGAWRYRTSNTGGRVYVYYGSSGLPGILNEGEGIVYGEAGDASWTQNSYQGGSWYGYSVAGAGNVNGDTSGGHSCDDVIISAPSYNNKNYQTDQGRAYVYLGNSGGLSYNLTILEDLDTPTYNALYGYSVASAGDVNGDGYDDVIVGSRYYNNGESNEGGAFIYLGSAGGTIPVASWTGGSNMPNAQYGTTVASAGDLNSDGYDDILIGAPGYDLNGDSFVGRTYMYYGEPMQLPYIPYIATDMVGNASGDFNSVYGELDSFGMGIISSVSIDNNHHRLFVSDGLPNSRVLVFNLDVDNTLINREADFVLGQGNMSTNGYGTSSTSMYRPRNILYDNKNDRLFVSDSGNHRILVFDGNSIQTNMSATYVIGQIDFDSNTSNVTDVNLSSPMGLAYDSITDRLFVTDMDNYRVLTFDVRTTGSADKTLCGVTTTGIETGMSASCVIGRIDLFNYNGEGPTQEYFYSGPRDVAYDSNNNLLYVADSLGSRVLVFDVRSEGSTPKTLCGTTTTGLINNTNSMPASCVIGQTSFTSSNSGISDVLFNTPRGLWFDDDSSTLFVAEVHNSRVLAFDTTSLVNGLSAQAVIGQVNFTDDYSATTSHNFDDANAVTFDPVNDRLYVADANNSRVMMFDLVGESLVKHTITLDGSLNGVLVNNNGVNIETTGSSGVQDVLLMFTNQNPIAEIYINLSEDRDWSSVTAGEDLILGKSFIHGLTTQTGAATTFVLYVPIPEGTTSNRVIVCPGSSTLNEVVEGCTNAISYTEGQFVSGGTVTKVTMNSHQYWRIPGMTGTGGLSMFSSFTMRDTMTRLQVSTPSNHDIYFGSAYGLQTSGENIVLKFNGDWDMSTLTVADLIFTSGATTLNLVENNPDVDVWGVVTDNVTNTITLTTPLSGTGYIAANDILRLQILNNKIVNPTNSSPYMIEIDIHNDAHGGPEYGQITVPIVDSDQVNITGYVNAYLHFDIDTGVGEVPGVDTAIDCNYDSCLSHENGIAGDNYTVDLGELKSTYVNKSNDVGVMHSDGILGIVNSIYFDLTTNALTGAVITVSSASEGLQGPDTKISSVTDGEDITNNSGFYGFNLPVESAQLHGTIVKNSLCESAGAFCGPTLDPKEVFNTANHPVDGARIRMDIAAAVAYTNTPGAYTDTLTFVATATF